MPCFAVSIAALSLVQGALVALPGRLPGLPLKRVRSRWWALVPALSIVVVIGVIEVESGSATFLSWLALVTVPPAAALGLGCLVRGARPAWALAVLPLFAVAWAAEGSLAGETATTALTAFGCLGLSWLLVSVAPARLLELSIYAMALVDVCFVAAHLLQEPNAVLSAADPGGLPPLQVVEFGAARMGFGDVFVAALFGHSARSCGRVGGRAGAGLRPALPCRGHAAGDRSGRGGPGDCGPLERAGPVATRGGPAG